MSTGNPPGGDGEPDGDEESAAGYDFDIQPEAEQDITEAYRWYEERSAGLGDEFLRAVDACLEVVGRHPAAFTAVHKQVRRALLRRFPYGIFYVIQERRIVVIACFHACRDLKAWRRRI